MISEVEEKIAPFQQKLITHPLYKRITTPEHLKLFMEHHVYAVWDFMSLLKALQKELTCIEVPWKPKGTPDTRYLINEIVLAEETDINRDGQRLSHYEMYLDAMESAGADTKTIARFISEMPSTDHWQSYIANAIIPDSIKDFLSFTFNTISSKESHCIAAAFTFGREDLIPDMFSAIIQNIRSQFPESELDELQYYFDRHIELDGDEHGPMALQMVSQLCDTPQKWEEVMETSIAALKVRIKLWDGILEAIEAKVAV